MVRVILNERNHTTRVGEIRELVWHHKDQCYHYYIRESATGKKVSKRYLAEDLEPIEE